MWPQGRAGRRPAPPRPRPFPPGRPGPGGGSPVLRGSGRSGAARSRVRRDRATGPSARPRSFGGCRPRNVAQQSFRPAVDLHGFSRPADRRQQRGDRRETSAHVRPRFGVGPHLGHQGLAVGQHPGDAPRGRLPSGRPFPSIRLPRSSPATTPDATRGPISPPRSATEPAVEIGGRIQQPAAQLLELVLFQYEVLADSGVERSGSPRLREVIARLYWPCATFELGVGGGELAVRPGLAVQRPGPGRPWPAVCTDDDRQEAGQADQQRGRRRRDQPRFRRAHRRTRRRRGSRQADTGSSASQRSTSSASSTAVAYRSCGSRAMAFRQTASSAGSIPGSTWRGRGNSPRCTLGGPRRRPPLERRTARQHAVERRPQAVHVARGPSRSSRPRPARGSCTPACPADPAASRRAAPEAGTSVSSPSPMPGPPARSSLGQAPVHHQRLAVLAQHHVARLQVAVEDPPAVGVGHRVADSTNRRRSSRRASDRSDGVAAGRIGGVEARRWRPGGCRPG